MELLNLEQIVSVSGGCAEHCWGHFTFGGFTASVYAGAVGGAMGGFGGMALGGFAGGLGYAGSKVGDKMSERTTDE